MGKLLTRTEIIAQIAELRAGKNFWYWAMKAKVDPAEKKIKGGNVTYFYPLDAVEKIKAALKVRNNEIKI
jgi:hypothetical protein